MIDNINWYPGHMKKTRELIKENLKAVDVVIEIIDSRIPVSSRNPVIDELISGKRRIVVMGKADLADDGETAKWKEKISQEKSVTDVLDLNLQSGENIKKTLTKWDEENQTCQVKVDEENILDLTTANAEIPVGYFPQVEDVVQVEYDSEKMDVINMILIERPDPDPQTPPDRNESQTKQPEATQETTTKAPTTTTTTTTTKPTTTTTKATTAAPTEAPEDSGNGED